MEKAKEALKKGTSLVWRRIKLIRIADKSEFGWETVNQYEADELASNSEDDKRIYRSKRRADKTHKEKKKKKSPPVRSSFSSTSTLSAAYPIPSLVSNRGLLRSSLGPRFACGKFGHLQTKCPQRAVFQPTSLDVAKPRS